MLRKFRNFVLAYAAVYVAVEMLGFLWGTVAVCAGIMLFEISKALLFVGRVVWKWKKLAGLRRFEMWTYRRGIAVRARARERGVPFWQLRRYRFVYRVNRLARRWRIALERRMWVSDVFEMPEGLTDAPWEGYVDSIRS